MHAEGGKLCNTTASLLQSCLLAYTCATFVLPDLMTWLGASKCQMHETDGKHPSSLCALLVSCDRQHSCSYPVCNLSPGEPQHSICESEAIYW